MQDLLASLETPTLLLNESVCRANLQRMAERAARHGLRLRPHAKTHQSRTVARWCRDYGIDGLTVSSLRMAAYFAEDGWDDLTVAFPANIREAGRIRELSGRVRLNLLAESLETLEALDRLVSRPTGLFISADTGYGRTGLRPGEWDRIDPLVERMATSDRLIFRGFLCHAGHAYAARGPAQIREVHAQTLRAMHTFRERYAGLGEGFTLSIGDTPSCSVADDFSGADEMRPGNFAFYDLDQVLIGSCGPADIAIALACPVVALHPDRMEAVLYGGGVHLSKDRQQRADGSVHYGQIGRWEPGGWSLPPDAAYLRRCSQEHGVARYLDREAFRQVRIGDLLPVLPVHACMTADAMGGLRTLDGQAVDMMPKTAA